MLSRRGDFLLYSSDRTGSLQAFRMDLKSGESRLLTAADNLDASSLTLLPHERAFCYFDGPSLRLAELSNLSEREVYRIPDGSKRGPGFSVTPDSAYALLIEVSAGVSMLRTVRFPRGALTVPLASPVPLADPLSNPQGDAILLHKGPDSLWWVRRDGRDSHALATEPGNIGPAFWSPDGSSVLYLNLPIEPGKLNSIRELDPVANTSRLISPTSQFVSFAPNADATVFAGSSGSRAAPYLLILLRRTRRELALCEHRASDPRRVTLVFSPDSQQILFQSDRHGRWAIYAMPVSRLVEPTGAV
jgi:oligogalacturonide lyase